MCCSQGCVCYASTSFAKAVCHFQNQGSQRLSHRRLVLWREGRIAELVAEVETIQRHWAAHERENQHANPEARLALRFARLVSGGRVRAAIRLLSSAGPGTPLDLDASVPGTANDSISPPRSV